MMWTKEEKIQTVFDEIKTQREQGIVLSPSGKRGAFDCDLVDNPHVFRMGGDWYMTYVGHDGEGYRTGLAGSKDLLKWERLGLIMDHSHSDGTWDRYNAAGCIVRDHIWGQAPAPHRHNGKYVMPYLGSQTPGYECGDISVGLATADHIAGPWKREDQPILVALENDMERNAIWKIHILPLGTRYMAFFPAGRLGIVGHEWMSAAYSDNLVDWVREKENPLLKMTLDENGGKWGVHQTGDCEVVKIDDTWVMIYFTDSPYGIIDSFAISDDLVKWAPSHIPLLERKEPYNRTYAHKPCIFKHEGTVYHFYNAVGDSGRVIALATSR